MANFPIADFKDRLRQAVEEANIKPIELAEKTQIPISAISQYMSGYTNPRLERIDRLARALSVDHAWLLGYDVPMRKPKENPFSIDNAHMVAKIRNDEPLTDALQKYFESTEDKRRKVVAMMNMMLED